MNFLAVRALHHYGSIEGPYAQQARSVSHEPPVTASPRRQTSDANVVGPLELASFSFFITPYGPFIGACGPEAQSC